MFTINIRLKKHVKINLEINRAVKFVRDCYQNQKMCDKADDNYSHVLKLVPDYYKTQNMCKKGVDTYPSIKKSCF